MMLLSLCAFLEGTPKASAQTVVTNPANPWIVPAGVTSIKVEVCGGGGGGGGACNLSSSNQNGGAGAAGQVVITYTVCPTINVTVNGQANPLCFGGSTGIITVTASGGTAPYQFSLDNGLNCTTGSKPNPHTFTGLSANVPYKIRVKDSNGCTSPEIL
ncbi:MAG: SprB repeat-containing protein [Bacteroidia bacterium]|nr:SprB repeat-containing protein [Bacteroidia bacterium]